MQPNTALKNLASKATALRTGRGHTISKLAGFKTCEVSESTIRRIEKAHVTGYNPSLATLVRVASTFEVPVAQLIGQMQAAKPIAVTAKAKASASTSATVQPVLQRLPYRTNAR